MHSRRMALFLGAGLATTVFAPGAFAQQWPQNARNRIVGDGGVGRVQQLHLRAGDQGRVGDQRAISVVWPSAPRSLRYSIGRRPVASMHA